jgi:hypothetical protein
LRNYVGIDVAKDVHWVSAIDQDARVLIDKAVQNDQAAIEALAAELRRLGPDLGAPPRHRHVGHAQSSKALRSAPSCRLTGALLSRLPPCRPGGTQRSPRRSRLCGHEEMTASFRDLGDLHAMVTRLLDQQLASVSAA